MDEQFLTILHAIEGITDATPLREAAKQLPKQIYEIIQSQEQLTGIPAKLTDQLVFDVAKTYYYSVIESLCKLIKSIQQGQRTSLVSLAKIVQDQRDEIERYQTLLKLPEEVRQLQQEMEKLKKHVDIHLERTDKKTSVTSVTISEIRSQIHRMEATIEGNFEHIPEPDQPSWVFPSDIVEIHAPEEDILFHGEHDRQVPSNEHQQWEEDSATGGELQENQDNIPCGLSPPRRYIPAGAEGGDSSLSSSTCDEEETVIECLCKLIKSIQQGQRTALVSLAKIIQDQRDEIEGYQALLKLPEEMRKLQQEMEKLKKHVNVHLERTDKKTTITSVTISEIRSQIHRLEATIEGNFEYIPEPDQPSWVFPGDIVQIHSPENDTLLCGKFEEQVPFSEHQQQDEDPKG